MNNRNAVVILSIFSAMVLVASGNPNVAYPNAGHEVPKTDLTARHNDALAARVNLGTAISLAIPVVLGVALITFLAPMFQSLFSPIAFGPSLGYARKGKSLLAGLNQDHIFDIIEKVTKAVESFNDDVAKPKTQ